MPLSKQQTGVRLQVSFGEEKALIYRWQILKEAR